MMRLDKLKGLLRERKKSYSDLAEILGLTPTSVSNKLNGKSPITCAEAEIMSEWLDIPYQDRANIFLS